MKNKQLVRKLVRYVADNNSRSLSEILYRASKAVPKDDGLRQEMDHLAYEASQCNSAILRKLTEILESDSITDDTANYKHKMFLTALIDSVPQEVDFLFRLTENDDVPS